LPNAEHAPPLVLSRQREPEERRGVCASGGRHEAGWLTEEAGRIGTQLDKEVVDAKLLITGSPTGIFAASTG
jgi:hypothetical protein